MIRNRSLIAMEWSRSRVLSAVLLATCGWLFAAEPVAIAQEASSTASAAYAKFTEFDVATIRENRSSGPAHLNFPLTNGDEYAPVHGYLQALNLPLIAFLQFAYRMDALQVVALQRQLPDWALSARYDIEARVDGEPGKDDMRRMVRALLASRFKLQLRQQVTTGNVYDLVLVHPGKLGPSLHVHAADDAQCQKNRPEGFFSPCGAVGFGVRDTSIRTVRMAGRKIVPDQLLFYATTQMGRPVLNRTGLTEQYDFTLEYAQQRYNQTPGDIDSDSPNPDGQTFPDALRDQLGLKLVPDKGPITSYVVEHLEKPSEN